MQCGTQEGRRVNGEPPLFNAAQAVHVIRAMTHVKYRAVCPAKNLQCAALVLT
jgi:hypothetical protein